MELIRNIPGKIKSLKIKSLIDNIIDKIIDNILNKIPKEKRMLVITGFGVIVFLIICLVFISISGRQRSPEPQMITNYALIPHDELFYPAEPDFVPRLLLEREPRGHWTADDLMPFWLDPRQREDEWREAARVVIDRFMEGVN